MKIVKVTLGEFFNNSAHSDFQMEDHNLILLDDKVIEVIQAATADEQDEYIFTGITAPQMSEEEKQTYLFTYVHFQRKGKTEFQVIPSFLKHMFHYDDSNELVFKDRVLIYCGKDPETNKYHMLSDDLFKEVHENNMHGLNIIAVVNSNWDNKVLNVLKRVDYKVTSATFSYDEVIKILHSVYETDPIANYEAIEDVFKLRPETK